MIKQVKQFFETQTTLLQKKANIFKDEIIVNMDGGVGGSWKVECAVDEETIPCTELDYTGVPAPQTLDNDPWFGDAVISDANMEYKQLEFEAFKEEAHKFYGTKEPENIHQLMYDMATEGGKHTTAAWFDAGNIGGSENFIGGSENVHG